MRFCRFLALIASLFVTTLLLGQTRPHSYSPREGFVPDEKTAIRVAEAVLSSIYSDERIQAQRPFSAKLERGVWVVTGHLPEGSDGGVAEIKIDKKTCEVLHVTHGK